MNKAQLLKINTFIKTVYAHVMTFRCLLLSSICFIAYTVWFALFVQRHHLESLTVYIEAFLLDSLSKYDISDGTFNELTKVLMHHDEQLMWLFVLSYLMTTVLFALNVIIILQLIQRNRELCKTQMEMAFLSKIRQQEMSIMLQGLAHELKTPIFSISSMCITLMNKYARKIEPSVQVCKTSNCLGCSGRNFLTKLTGPLQKIETACQQMGDITTSLTAYGENVRKLKLVTINAKELVKTSVRYARFADTCKDIPQENISYKDLCKGTDLTITVVPGDITMAIQNAINNAVYAIQERMQDELIVENPPEVIVSIETRMINNLQHCVISVSDNGIGMTPEELDLYQQPFFTSRGHKQGTGLGLYLVKRNVEYSKGILEIKSTKFKGTTLEFIFPCSITVVIPEVYRLARPVTLYTESHLAIDTVYCKKLSVDGIDLDTSDLQAYDPKVGESLTIQLWFGNRYHMFRVWVSSKAPESMELKFTDESKSRVADMLYESL
jgi:signal transduction histidine kinase